MAKNFIKPRKHETGRTITTKTAFGTTGDMVVNDEKITSRVKMQSGQVLAKDDAGYYITPRDRVDNGFADWHRYDSQYREYISNKIMEELGDE
jgi:hypothetical protein